MFHRRIAIAVIGIATALVLVGDVTGTQSNSEQSVQVVAHETTLTEDEASLALQLSSGETVRVTLVGGAVILDRTGTRRDSRIELARYELGGELEAAWHTLVSEAMRLDPSETLLALQQWRVDGLTGVAVEVQRKTIAPFAELQPGPVMAPVSPVGLTARPGVPAEPLESTIANAVAALEGLEGLEALRALETLKALERLEGAAHLEGLEELRELENLSALEALQSLQQLKSDTPQPAQPLGFGSLAGQVGSDLFGLLASFIALGALGFGLAFFAPLPLEVVADTVRHSFWRSFLVGLFAQPLVIPLFGMLLLGLALTVIGVVLIPFAVIGFAIAAVLAVVGGYIAVARSVGEAYLRGRMSQGYTVGGWLSYRYIIYGLAGLMAVWLPAVLLGWVPLAGTISTVSAIVITWMLATAGFGAAILSRAGIRSTFTRRFDQALSDEYLYNTPRATPILETYDRTARHR
jgi:hypothetical protein